MQARSRPPRSAALLAAPRSVPPLTPRPHPRRKEALKPIGSKKEVQFADFKSIMAGLTDTTPTKDIVNAFKVFDKDVRARPSLASSADR